jgi:hypothetical protein
MDGFNANTLVLMPSSPKDTGELFSMRKNLIYVSRLATAFRVQLNWHYNQHSWAATNLLA